MKRILLIVVLFAFAKATSAQHLFKDKYEGCSTKQFALESETKNAIIEEDSIVKVVLQNIELKKIKKLKGELKLQILVDVDGSSCLLSAENDTNIKSKHLINKERIDAMTWNPPTKKVAAIVAIKFKKGRYQVHRLGVNATKGVHVLKTE